LKRLTGKEMCRVLTRHGWSLQRINGSHHIFTKPGQPNHASVPVHGNKLLDVGTQRNIMRQAGLTDDDL
jgi:predicted RNA binding protein YcfA (HicA-like mRNA interferase family)